MGVDVTHKIVCVSNTSVAKEDNHHNLNASNEIMLDGDDVINTTHFYLFKVKSVI
jgi:hypothetical protein